MTWIGVPIDGDESMKALGTNIRERGQWAVQSERMEL